MSSWSASDTVRNAGMAEEATYRLREAILNSRLRPGARIVERELSDAFGLSRGPIRDALKNLEAEGLVDISPRRGARVAILTKQDAEEVIALRAAVEPIAVEFSLTRHRDAMLADLDDLLARMALAVEAGDWPAAMLLDLQFHEMTYLHSDARRTQRVWQAVKPVLLRAFKLHPQVYRSGEHIYASHAGLLEVLKTGSVEQARSSTRDHVLDLTPAVLRLLQS